MGFVILILIWVHSLVFYTPMFRILALYLDFIYAKNIYATEVLMWSFRGRLMLLTGVWHLVLDFDIVTGLCYTHVPNFGSLS